jgi:N-formylglutamate amidohydrolase
MAAGYTFHSGNTPLLISVPHEGTRVPDDIAASMTQAGRSLPDTDWHVGRLYDFGAELGAAMIIADYSRYVVDLNRPADDTTLYEGQLTTGLCPTQTFAGQDIYKSDATIDTQRRVRHYWQPYHDKVRTTLEALRAEHGCALLWDAHSIASRVPSLFDGELRVLNIGTWDGRSCSRVIEDAVAGVADASPYDAVVNGRFKGGYITRRYGRPEQGVHALQLELAQRAYMDEATQRYAEKNALQLRDTLRDMLSTILEIAASNPVILSR